MYYPEESSQLKALFENLNQPVLVLGHISPDGDALGSQIALTRVLNALGKEAYLGLVAEDTPTTLKPFLKDTPYITLEGQLDLALYTLVAVDTANYSRLPRIVQEQSLSVYINIDHHVSNHAYAEHNFVLATAAATAEFLAKLALDNAWQIDAVTAQALYLALATDTVQFRAPAVTQSLFELVARLVEFGASPYEAACILDAEVPMGKMRLLAAFLNSLRLECDEQVCIGFLNAKLYEDTGAKREDAEGLVDYTRNVAGVQIGILIEEREGEMIKGSMRALDPKYRLDLLAKKFNGGGHFCAAGFRIEGYLDDFYPKFIEAIKHLFSRALIMLHNTNLALDGILFIDKPLGCTSHDVVDRVRRKLQMRRVGHAGTLDPRASGVMIILVGRATKVSQYLMSLDKEYTGTIKLGETTNTQDSEGEILMTQPVPPLEDDELHALAKDFLGDQYQTPPMFSAKKVDGQPLYKLARKGKEIERKPRFIRINHFELTKIYLPEIDFVLNCTKGTYVRTIAHDFGKRLDCGAHLSRLRRSKVGQFDLDQCLTLEDLEDLSITAIREALIAPVDAVPSHFFS